MAKRSAAPTRVRARNARLSHVASGPDGAHARMVDVGKKVPQRRSALARALLRFPPGVRDVVWSGRGPKGPVEEVARCAGLLAAKRTADLIPMCHPLALDHLELTIEPRADDLLEVACRASTTGKTGVEMEALTGAAVAALAIYDMTKALDKGIVIERLELREKSGGKSGHWRAAPDAAAPTRKTRAR